MSQELKRWRISAENKVLLLTLGILVEFSFWFETINLGLSILHIWGVRQYMYYFTNIVFFCLKIILPLQTV